MTQRPDRSDGIHAATNIPMLPDVLLFQVYRGIIAFFIVDLARLLLFVSVPGLVLWLVCMLT